MIRQLLNAQKGTLINMQILELSLHNYKIHRKLNLKFDSGVVGILGDNGSGKSSIISAICFLFTGEVDTDRKSECLTLGETEGWVRGKFELNGKEGVLERHLNSSQISLTYDGVNYRKASEVNQLWNELLQIDSTIFNNVIVAKQGEIQNLFSDETAVREKIFQKIFMVPPTEKIRNVIWDNYIKVCPPERPEEDTTITAANSTGFVLITSSGPLVTANSTLQEKSTMANTKTTTVSITKNSKKKMEEVVRARTTSRNYNILLANKIYSSTMTLKDIANKVGISTRSLRDYSFYNTTVPANVATNLVKLFKTSYTQLGLMLNQDTNRYEHRQIVVKS